MLLSTCGPQLSYPDHPLSQYPNQTWSRLLQTGTFWLCLLVLVTMVSIKDMFIVGMQRAFTTDPRLILQEVSYST